MCRIPSHFMIDGEDQADSAAMSAPNKFPDIGFRIPYGDLKNDIDSFIKQK